MTLLFLEPRSLRTSVDKFCLTTSPAWTDKCTESKTQSSIPSLLFWIFSMKLKRSISLIFSLKSLNCRFWTQVIDGKLIIICIPLTGIYNGKKNCCGQTQIHTILVCLWLQRWFMGKLVGFSNVRLECLELHSPILCFLSLI